MFSFITDALGIEKGALLLPDHNREYFSCWITAGYDKTTERRLRIPADLINGVYTEPELMVNPSSWGRYFSRREQSFLDPFLLCPLISDENFTTGLIIIAESSSFDLQHLLPGLNEIMQAAGNFLYRSRQKTLDMLSGSSTETCDPDSIADFCRSTIDRGQHAVLISFSPLPFIDSLDIETDRYRLFEDVGIIVTSLVSGNGRVCRTTGGKICMVIQTSAKIDVRLIHHQITSTLSSFFSSSSEIGSPGYRVIVLPDDGVEPREAVITLLSE